MENRTITLIIAAIFVLTILITGLAFTQVSAAQLPIVSTTKSTASAPNQSLFQSHTQDEPPLLPPIFGPPPPPIQPPLPPPILQPVPELPLGHTHDQRILYFNAL